MYGRLGKASAAPDPLLNCPEAVLLTDGAVPHRTTKGIRVLHRRLHFISGLALLGSTLVQAQAVQAPVAETPEVAAAAPAQPPGPRFAVRGYTIGGNTLLAPELLQQAVEPYTGPDSDFQTIQSALEALEKLYLDLGYGSVRVVLPEQEVRDGLVRMDVLEATLAHISVEGAQHHSEDNIRRSLPALQPGQVVNTRNLQRDTRLANEQPFKQTGVVFRRSSAPGQVDAVVKVRDERPWRWAATLDNTGTPTTGTTRAGVLFQHGNLWERDHVLSAQAIVSPEKLSDVTVVGMNYRIPLHGLGDSLDFTAAYSNVDSGTLSMGGADYALSGSGHIYGVRYQQRLQAALPWQQSLSYSLDFKKYRNQVAPVGGGGSLVPDFVVTPLGLTYTASRQSAQRDWAASAGVVRNIVMHRLGNTAHFNRDGGRQGAQAGFTALRGQVQWTERLANQSSLKASLSGQWTRDLLLSAEQFGVGGADSVRGYPERDAGGDRGWRTSLEWVAPDVAARSGQRTDWRITPLVFVDYGHVSRNQPLPGEAKRHILASSGVGLRVLWRRDVSVKLDWARTLRASASTAQGHDKVHAQVLWFF